MADEEKPQPPRRMVVRKVQAAPLPASAPEAAPADPDDAALRALSAKYGVPPIDLSKVVIAIAHLVMPREVATAHRVLPVLVKDDRVFLAMVDPSEARVIDELEFVTGKKVFPYVALPAQLQIAIDGAYDAQSGGAARYAGANAPARGPTISVDALPPALPSSRSLDEIAVSDPTLDDSVVLPLPDGLRAKVVLVVDDVDEIRRLLRAVLETAGYQVVEASAGLAALQMVKQYVPDLIVLDAMLPEVHGFDIARRIRGSAKYGAIPIVMISAMYRGWRIAEDLKASYGIQAFIEKPFKIAEVAATVARLLAGSTAEAGPRSERVTAAGAAAETALAEGMAAYGAGAIERAIEIFSRGVAADPLAFRLRYQLGLILGASGQVFEAVTHLEHAIELRPAHFGALRNVAVLYEKAGFNHRAIEVWERAAAHAPDVETRARIKEQIIRLLR